MNSEIRKISVGAGFPDKCIHYQVGKHIGNGSKIAAIIEREADDYTDGIENLYCKAYDIFIQVRSSLISEGIKHEILLWKTVENMPVVIENNINFK